MSQVIQDLQRWGPETDHTPASLNFAEQYTLQLATSHYENFPVISWAVPKSLRQHFANVYAFCRWADDLGDETGSPEQSLQLLLWWRDQLNACFSGETSHPVFVALQPTIEEFSIPIDPFDDLISAFEQDQTITRYDTFDQLHDYCRRSANPVGKIVLHLIRQATPQNLKWSDSICTGLQLANFWQDVDRDLSIGRVYLPREDRERFNYEIDDLETRRFNDEFRSLLEFEVERTQDLLDAGQPLVKSLPGRWRVAIDLFRRGGDLILQRIRELDYDVWATRPVVTKRDLLGAGLKSALRVFG